MSLTFFFTFRARPITPPTDLDDMAGAYVNCWLVRDDMAEAEEEARRDIAESGWVIESLEEATTITDEYYIDKPDGKEYFEQAQLDKEVYVYHNWPLCEVDPDNMQ